MKNRLTRWLATVSTTLFTGVMVTGMAFTGMVEAQELGPGARPVGADWSRSPVMSVNGMAATAQPLASNIAIDVLQACGSAVDALRARGHKVEVDDTAGKFGGYQAISRDPKTGVLTGATEMRKDGTVVGY